MSDMAILGTCLRIFILYGVTMQMRKFRGLPEILLQVFAKVGISGLYMQAIKLRQANVVQLPKISPMSVTNTL